MYGTDEQKLIATGRLGTPVDVGPLDELTVLMGWQELPNRVWISDFPSTSPWLNVPLPRDSSKRQAVLRTIDMTLSATETGVGKVEDFLSIFSLLGLSVEPTVDTILALVGFGTKGIKRVKVRGIVEREKIVAVACESCGDVYDFGVWSVDELEENTQTCASCGVDLSTTAVRVL
jgi:hypothetical protein